MSEPSSDAPVEERREGGPLPVARVLIRGEEYVVDANDVTCALWLALVSLNDSRVDAVLSKFAVRVQSNDGRVIWPR